MVLRLKDATDPLYPHLYFEFSDGLFLLETRYIEQWSETIKRDQDLLRFCQELSRKIPDLSL